MSKRQKERRSFTELERRLIWERGAGMCGICDLAVAFDSDMHIDHVVAWANGGRNEPSNLRATHARCNLTCANRCDAAKPGPRPVRGKPKVPFSTRLHVEHVEFLRSLDNAARFIERMIEESPEFQAWLAAREAAA